VEDLQVLLKVDHSGFDHMEDSLQVVEGPSDLQDHRDHQVVGMVDILQEDQSILLDHPGSHMEDSPLALEDHVLVDRHVQEDHYDQEDHHAQVGHHVQEDHHGQEDRHGQEGHYNPQVLRVDLRSLRVLKEDHQMGILKEVLLHQDNQVQNMEDIQGSLAGLQMVGSYTGQKVAHHEESEMEGCGEKVSQMGENGEREPQLVLAVGRVRGKGCLEEQVYLFQLKEGLLSLE